MLRLEVQRTDTHTESPQYGGYFCLRPETGNDPRGCEGSRKRVGEEGPQQRADSAGPVWPVGGDQLCPRLLTHKHDDGGVNSRRSQLLQ